MAHKSDTPRGLVDAAVAGRLDIPEFQRGFVWNPEKVKNLLDSLCRDYPVGAILCWQATDYREARNISSTEPNRLWIVDGQQRTTALCLLLGKKPYWFPSPEPWETHYRRCNVQVDVLADDEDLVLSLPNPIIEKNPRWVPVRHILSSPSDQVPKLAFELLERTGGAPTDVAHLTKIMSVITRLQQAFQREIVTIEIGHDPVDVAEIFSRLNSAGTRVNEGDVALALLAVRQQGWVRAELLPFLQDLSERGYSFDPSFVIRSMAAVRRSSGRLRDVPREFWEDSADFRDGWSRSKNAISNVVRIMRELGVLSDAILPSRNVLIPLFVLDDHIAHGNAQQLKRAFVWMLRATRDGRYSGSAMSTVDQDLIAIRDAKTDFDIAVSALESKLRSPLQFVAADMLRRYDQDDFLKLMLYLTVFDAGAEDWKTGQRLGFDRSDNSLNDGFRPEWHHFVPRGRLRRRSSPPAEEQINALANIVVLSEGDNRRFSYSEPHGYLAKHHVPDSRVIQQFFPSDRELWKSESFEGLLNERSTLLANAMNEYIAKLGGSSVV